MRAKGIDVIKSLDARTGEPRGFEVAESTEEDIGRAVGHAAALFEEWAGRNAAQRGEVLESLADAVLDASGILVSVAEEETALGVERLRGEVARTAGQLRFFSQVIRDGAYLGVVIDRAQPGTSPDLRRWLVPVGPVAVFGASNFPFAFSVLGGDTASALAAGCPVVVKAHPSHPETAARTAEAIDSALTAQGLGGLVQVVHGFEAGVSLTRHPGIRAVGFTGSLEGGRRLADIAAARPDPIPFYGELGSLNPVVVTREAARERGAEIGRGLAASAILGSGQFCTQPGLWLLPADPAADRLVECAATALAEAPPMHLLNEGLRDRFGDQVAQLLALPGVCEVTRREPTESVRTVRPVLLQADPSAVGGTLTTECFGPVAVVVRYADEAQLRSILARLPGSLTATLHQGQGEDVRALVPGLARFAGRVIFNGYPTGVAVSWAMTHGGPWPAATTSNTSVGAAAIDRFLRPITYQDAPPGVLPPELQDGRRLVPMRDDGRLVQADPQALTQSTQSRVSK